MKSRLLLLLPLLLPVCALAQTGQPPEDNNLGPAMLIMAFIVLMGMIAITLTMCILLLVNLAIVALLVFCGVLSQSVLTNIYHHFFSKSPSVSMKAASALAGCIVGAAIGLMMKTVLHFDLSSASTLLIALPLGGIVGWLIANILVKAGRMLLHKIVSVSS